MKSLKLLPILVAFTWSSCNKTIDEPLLVQKKVENPASIQISNMLVSINEASLIAQRSSKFFGRNSKGKTASFSFKTKSILKSSISSINSTPYYYVFNFKEGGWVIISADRRTMPILAYSNNGYFDDNNKPIGVVIWEENTKKHISKLRMKSSSNSLNAVIQEWNYLNCIEDPLSITKSITNSKCHSPDELISVETVEPLIKTGWGQGCGYNQFCKVTDNIDNCFKSPTGCVATAMAQVVKYWQYPNYYNYNNMPYSSGNYDVAKLMLDCGKSVHMHYENDGSHAKFDSIHLALKQSFQYSSATYNSKSEYNHNSIVYNIVAKQPVILGACQDSKEFLGIPYRFSNCHAWVCDGYSRYIYVGYTLLMFHMNWGWSGAYDGWYQFNNWDITEEEINYQYYKEAIINIHP